MSDGGVMGAEFWMTGYAGPDFGNLYADAWMNGIVSPEMAESRCCIFMIGRDRQDSDMPTGRLQRDVSAAVTWEEP